MSLRLDTPARRIAFAIGISLLLHGLVLWGPHLQPPHFESSLTPLAARLETPLIAPAKPKRKVRAAPKPKAEPATPAAPGGERQLAASSVAAASASPAAETLAQTVSEPAPPPLPRRAQLIFAVNKGTSDFKVGEVMHTLEIDDGHYVLLSVTETVGLAKLFKPYRITQYSSGSYSRQGLQPERFFEERADKLSTQRYTAEFDHTAKRATFSHGGEAELPPAMQDILSILYQFPLVSGEMVGIHVANGKKVERYEFEVTNDVPLHTALGELNTVHLSKVHQANEEGLEIWLAPEYRLFPVKMRIIEKSGEISGEIVITAIHAEFEEETSKDVDH